MELSILIPTHERFELLARCLSSLVSEASTIDCEILVGVDGPSARSTEEAVPVALRSRCAVVVFERMGYISVRRRLLEAARGRIVLSLNDDVRADPGLLRGHLDLHAGARPRVVAGAFRWQPISEPTLFDAIVQGSDLLFASSPSVTVPTAVDHRRVYGLNMSFPRRDAIDAGGFHDLRHAYGYDDIELAHRLEASGAQIMHAPSAAVVHDHRFLPIDVHRREYLLGRAFAEYATAAPDFARDLAGADVVSASWRAYAAAAIARERRDAMRIERSFCDLSQHPANFVDGALLPILAEHWIPLKRFLWRWGVHDALHGRPFRWSTLDVASELP